MITRSNSELIAAYLDAVLQRDVSVVEQFFHPNVEYIVNGTVVPDPMLTLPPISEDCHRALPWLGLHRGRQAVKDFLAHMHSNLEIIAYGPRKIISEGSACAAFGWFRLHALSTGRTADISYSIMFELRDGLIAKYHFLENTFDVAAAFRSDGEWLLETDNAKHHVPNGEKRQTPQTNP